MNDHNREAFEKWHDSLFDISASCAAWSGYGYPRDHTIQMRWQAWKAATQHERERIVKLIEGLNPHSQDVLKETVIDLVKEA